MALNTGRSVGKHGRAFSHNDTTSENIAQPKPGYETAHAGQKYEETDSVSERSEIQSLGRTSVRVESSLENTRKRAPSTALQGGIAHERLQSDAFPGSEAAREFLHLWAAVERHFTQNPSHSAVLNELISSTPPFVLGVTSAVAGEGKTTVAMNLAESAARYTWYRVCLVDLGLGDDDISRRHGVASDGTGVVSLLERCDSGDLSSQSLPTFRLEDRGGLTILPAGKLPANPARIARSPNLAALIECVRQQFDLIIVDLPAVSTENVLPLAAHLDGVVVVARAGATPGDVIEQAVNKIGRQSVIGIVLNRIKFSGPRWLKERLSRW